MSSYLSNVKYGIFPHFSTLALSFLWYNISQNAFLGEIFMGVDICYFIDHDLPADNPQALYEELKKRVKSDVILHNCDKTPFCEVSPKSDTYYILYGEDCLNTALYYEKDKYQFELEFYKKTVEVSYIYYDGKTAFDYLRWYQMLNYFRENEKEGHEWLKGAIFIYKKYLVPIFHSTKLLLIADSSSYRHETIWGDFIMENGNSIDEVVELNKTFSPPCKIWRNEEAFGRAKSDYENDSSDWIDAFFIFDL